MFTTNCERMMTLGVLAMYASGTYPFYGTIELTDPNGSKFYPIKPYVTDSQIDLSSYHSGNSTGIKLGSGTTPPTRDDYGLETYIPSGKLVCTLTNKRIYAEENGPYCVEYIFTVTNSSDDDVTISEIGRVDNVNATTSTYGGSSSSVSKRFLIDRTLLDTPITIPSNETATITYTLKASVSTASAS